MPNNSTTAPAAPAAPATTGFFASLANAVTSVLPGNNKKNKTAHYDHDLQVRDPFTLFLFWHASRVCDMPATRGSCAAAFSIGYPYRRTGFTVPQGDIDTIVVGRQPAVGAVFTSAVLAGEREHNFISAVIAPAHYCF